MGIVARGDDTDIPKGRIRRTAQVGSVVGSQGARYAGTRARNLARDPDEAAQALRGARAALRALLDVETGSFSIRHDGWPV